MVRAADELKGELRRAGGTDVEVALTGASGLWSDFNAANREAMMKSELISWPVTLAILVLAFGSLVAAGLPLMLTILGLVAAAGSLFVAGQVADVSIWAMNFALMFALALGIDYALFVVHRFRGALFGSKLPASEAVAVAMDTAGKAVLFSGLTVLVSLSAVLLVPSPAFRSMALGIMLSVIFVLAATLTLLPAVLAKLGPQIDRFGLSWVHAGEHRSPAFARWAEQSVASSRRLGLPGHSAAVVLGSRHSARSGWSIKVVPAELLAAARSRPGFGALRPELSSSSRAAAGEQRGDQRQRRSDHRQANESASRTLLQAVPTVDPSDPAVGDTIERLRVSLPEAALVGGSAAENHDLEEALSARTPLVVGVVLVLGFLLLLLALQAPVIAAAGVVTNLLATAAAFGVARLIFQEGNGTGVLGFESQGFLDAWGPVFFFAMIFAISMDYTVFLLSSAKEHWDRTADAKEAMVGGVAHSGRVIFAAAGVMVAIFFTFALSGPLPPKEMGVILGVAVLLDAALIRLVLMPVLLRLLGPAAWAQPRWLDRILPDVRFGHS